MSLFARGEAEGGEVWVMCVCVTGGDFLFLFWGMRGLNYEPRPL